MPGPKELDPTSGPLAEFGAELRKYRNLARITQAELASRISYSPSMVGLIETGRQRPSRDFLDRCEEALGLSGELARLWPKITREGAPRWFRPWLQAEQEAARLWLWEPLIVPGLFQIEQYARVIIRGEPGLSEAEIEGAIAERMVRQEVLERSHPPMVWALLDEGVLNRPLGGAETMRRQVEHLIGLASRSTISIQIVPYTAESTTGLLGGFAFAQTDGHPDTVYLESASKGQVLNWPDEGVTALRTQYEAIRSEAHPQHVSLALLREKLEQWT